MFTPPSLIDENTRNRSRILPSNLFLFGFYSADPGFYLFLDEHNKCHVCAPKHGSAAPVYSWDSLEQMFSSEVKRFSAFFDENGALANKKAIFSPPQFACPGSECSLVY